MEMSQAVEPEFQFDPISEDFNSLTLLGSLTEEFSWCGHTFKIKTLNLGEEIAVGKLIKLVENTVAQIKVIQTATAAACLVSVNGKPFMPDVMGDIEQNVDLRYNRVKTWYAPAVEEILLRYNNLLERRDRVIEDTKKKFRTGTEDSSDTSSPSEPDEFLKVT